MLISPSGFDGLSLPIPASGNKSVVHGSLTVRPEHGENESLRGYVSRVSSRNGSSPLLKPMLASLQDTTDAIQEIAMLTGCRDSVLKEHGSYTKVSNDGHSGVLFGRCVLSTNRVRMQQRMFCPICLSKNEISTCCWELRGYDVCHEHRCYLVGRCSSCNRQLSWASTSSEKCSCGVRLADMKTKMASTNRGLICKLIADHMSAIIARPNQAIAPGTLTPLNLFFIVSNFARTVLIPSFCQEHLGNMRSLSDQTSEELLLVILNDSEYCGHLHKVIFLHGVGNPIAMARALRAGITDREMRENFLPCLNKVTIHNELLKIKADVIGKRKLNFQPAPEFVSWAKEQRPEEHRFQLQTAAIL